MKLNDVNDMYGKLLRRAAYIPCDNKTSPIRYKGSFSNMRRPNNANVVDWKRKFDSKN